MRHLVFCLAVSLAPLPAQALEVALPSGKVAALYETILDQDAGIGRFRFTMDALQTDPEALTSGPERVRDLTFLCETTALPALRALDPERGAEMAAVVISVAARQTTFGDTTPDVAQFFEAFVIEGDHCIWDEF
ncbi:DUF6497 family protein [Roseicitreum antarcticum]|uniref:Acetolactate synthase n=1 Tax=Roseicitreum antarcticum TaxID=564137 RepID=A0A1H2VXW4_9RHOB|nr:DUF6497 family protein [Roseicitreum antarcticum]SDW72699.1 hypothetical protein SAMN04488238_103195 [Roseicitreum antarcticum]